MGEGTGCAVGLAVVSSGGGERKLESVQWLREQEISLGPKAGEWGYTDGCPWTAETCVAAARGASGHS